MILNSSHHMAATSGKNFSFRLLLHHRLCIDRHGQQVIGQATSAVVFQEKEPDMVVAIIILEATGGPTCRFIYPKRHTGAGPGRTWREEKIMNISGGYGKMKPSTISWPVPSLQMADIVLHRQAVSPQAREEPNRHGCA